VLPEVGTLTWEPDRCEVCGVVHRQRINSVRKHGRFEAHQTVDVVLCRVPGRPEAKRCQRHLLDLIRPQARGRKTKARTPRAVPVGQLELFG
jgi:hypothetical protein